MGKLHNIVKDRTINYSAKFDIYSWLKPEVLAHI